MMQVLTGVLVIATLTAAIVAMTATHVGVAGTNRLAATPTAAPMNMRGKMNPPRNPLCSVSEIASTWSEPKNLSDDESGAGTGWCQVKVDGNGRVYAIWKYIDENTVLEGPGGYCGGVLAIRCLDGGNWSKTIRVGDKHQPVVSWFAANGPDRRVHVIYTQLQPDIDADGRGMTPQIADDLNQLVLDGSAAPKATPVFVAKPLPTKAEIQAAHEAGKDFTYEQQNVQPDGLWNLRARTARRRAAAPHFIAPRAVQALARRSRRRSYRYDRRRSASAVLRVAEPTSRTSNDDLN